MTGQRRLHNPNFLFYDLGHLYMYAYNICNSSSHFVRAVVNNNWNEAPLYSKQFYSISHQQGNRESSTGLSQRHLIFCCLSDRHTYPPTIYTLRTQQKVSFHQEMLCIVGDVHSNANALIKLSFMLTNKEMIIPG